MEKPDRPKNRSFLDKAGDAADAVEMGVRLLWAGIMTCVFVSLAWWLGSEIWVGLAMILALPAALVGFLVGFFWPEVKFLGRLLLNLFFSPN